MGSQTQAAAPFEAWFDAHEAGRQLRLALAAAFEAGERAARKAAAESAPLAPSPVLDRALGPGGRALFTETVAAARAYDHDFRPSGRNWGSVPEDQAARIVEGALLHLRKAAGAGVRTVALDLSDVDAYHALTTALEDYAAKERDMAENEGGNESRTRWAESADRMRAQAEAAG